MYLLSQDILKQLIEAAKELEDKHIFHRDIKTLNILIETGSDVPRIRLIDFGVSCFCKKRSRYHTFSGKIFCSCSSHKLSFLYQNNRWNQGKPNKINCNCVCFLGTPNYCPPEFLTTKCYSSGPTTVWQLGAVLYEVLHDTAYFDAKVVLRRNLEISTDLSTGKKCLHFNIHCSLGFLDLLTSSLFFFLCRLPGFLGRVFKGRSWKATEAGGSPGSPLAQLNPSRLMTSPPRGGAVICTLNSYWIQTEFNVNSQHFWQKKIDAI